MSESQSPSAPRYLTNHEAAEFLRLSPRTLEKHRVTGGWAATMILAGLASIMVSGVERRRSH